MEPITTTPEPVRLGYLTCYGRGVGLNLQARCTCWWSGPRRTWGPDSIAEEQADLDAHLRQSGHRQLEPGDRAATNLHRRCGHIHDLDDDCAVPYDSPAGQLLRACQATLSRPRAALDQLTAATNLAAWAAHQQDEAVIAAHLAGVDLDHIADAAHLTPDDVIQRWGQHLNYLEHLDKAALEDRPYEQRRPVRS